MKRRSLAFVASAIAGSSLLLAGCGSSSPSTSSAPKAPSSIGNAAIVALPPQVSPNWWFPIMASSAYSVYNSQMNFLMYVPLIAPSKTDGIDYTHSLASNVSYNSNGTVYTITLNPKYKWSNGNPVTSADVVWTTKLLMYASNSSNTKLPWMNGGSGIGGLPALWKSVTAQGKDKVVITLNKPSNPQWFIRNGLGQIVPVPKSVWDTSSNMMTVMTAINKVANTPSASQYKVVDGPFKYDASASKPNNQYWTFVPNKTFGGHKASISKLVYQYQTSSSSEFAGLKTGKINVGFLPPSLWGSKSQLTNDKFSTSYAFGFNYFVPNLSSKAPGGFAQIMANAYARQALEMGINQQGMINTFYHGHGVVEFSPIPSKPKTMFYDSSLKNPAPYSPSAGKKLLESHGWVMKNGVMTKGSLQYKFTLLYASGSNTLTNELELMKQDWAKEGIQVSLVKEPFNQVISNSASSDPTKWQVVDWGGGWTYEPDYFPTGGGLFGTGSAANYGGYSNSNLDKLIKKTYEPGTTSQVTARMNAYQAFVAKNFPVIWMPWFPGFGETANYVSGVNKSFNPVLNINWPNYWTVNH